ncbi:Fc.00g077920.m01.CDS01 [Cosmosporella sp. VM-42]
MAPTADELSKPGSASYDSNTMVVGDGTWDFSKNTFLLPNLQGLNFETMRYNGMGNRFATLKQYHTLILAHAVMAAIIFLFFIPFSVMTARFYSRRPGWAVKYHAQVNILAGILLLAVFILGFFAVGPERNLSNPHHGIGVAIFTLFLVQLVGGRLIRRITKARSLRVMLHQWFGRAIALLGIVQIPLGLTLYGSPKYLFILYAVWMAFLLVVYFILSYRSEGRREFYMSGARSEAPSGTTRTRVTESEYFASDRKTDATSGRSKFLGPLAAGAGIWALARGRNKNKERDRSRSRSRSRSHDRSTRGPEVIPSRHGSASYLTGMSETEKYSELPPQKSSGGGFMKILAAIGAGKLVSGLMKKKDRRGDDSEYSAVSTETPSRYRPPRRGAATTMTDFTSDVSPDMRRDGDTRTSLIPPSGNPPVMAPLTSVADSRVSSQPPVTPRPSHNRHSMMRSEFEESDYSSYVSPSRRPIEEPRSGGFAKGVLGALGAGWFAKKMADRRARREEEQRIRDEEEMRSGTSVSRFTGDGHPSPTRRASRRPPPRRPPPGSSMLSSEMSESVLESRPPRGNYVPPTDTEVSTLPPVTPGPAPGPPSGSQSRHNLESVSMPYIPPDPQGIFRTESEGSRISPGSRPHRRTSRRHRAEELAAEAAAARTGEPSTDAEPSIRHEGRERYNSPSMSVKLKVHDDRDRNVTLRRLTEEERLAAARSRRNSDSSLDDIESPSYGRRHYRRDSSQRRAEVAAERRAEEEDQLPPLSPPNPAFAKGRRGKDSAYYSGQPGGQQGAPPSGEPGPSGTNNPMTMPDQTVSSLGSLTNPESRVTWSAMSGPSPPGGGPDTPSASAAADNRRRRRQERKRPSGVDMFD